jgi:hypothetical protein
MGLLDEAIRDHLDLKRRHGADPAEIERAEREALGPARRAPEDLDHGLFEDQVEGVADVDYATAPDLAPGSDSELEPGPAADIASGEAEGERAQQPYDHEIEPVPSDELSANEPAPPGAENIGGGESHAGDEEPPDDRGAAPIPPPHQAPDSTPQNSAAEGEPGHPPAHSGAAGGAETEEYQVEFEQEGKREEMLEETPEFLQDTPEHDRLWFEQRPPRDFDFDG